MTFWHNSSQIEILLSFAFDQMMGTLETASLKSWLQMNFQWAYTSVQKLDKLETYEVNYGFGLHYKMSFLASFKLSNYYDS